MSGTPVTITEEQWVQIALLLLAAFLLLRRLPLLVSAPILIVGLALIFPNDWLLQGVSEQILTLANLLLPLVIVCFGLWMMTWGRPRS